VDSVGNKILDFNIYIREVSSTMGVIILTAEESVNLFGWFAQPVKTLSWEAVKTHLFTWRHLRSYGIDAERLKRVQPDKHEWINRGGLKTSDLNDMTIFPINPITDFGVDLAELWQMQCSVNDLLAMNVTYEQLLEKGLSVDIMHCFGFPLSAWVDLGFKSDHAKILNNEESLRVFGMQTSELLTILSSFIPPESTYTNSIPQH